MGKPDAAVPPAQSVYRKVFKAQLSENRRSNFKAARATAKAACDGASLFVLSKAAVCFGTDQLARLLGPDTELRDPTSDELASYTNEAELYLSLAAECAWDGAECGSALCAAYYVELIILLGPVDTKAVERLKELRGELMRDGTRWSSEPNRDLLQQTAAIRDDDLGPCLMEVRSLWVCYCRLSRQPAASSGGVHA